MVSAAQLVRRSPIYYGWIIWVVATIGMLATAPGQSFTVSLFIDHFISDFSLDRTTVASIFGLGTALAALSLTWVGRQIDLYGNRRMSLIVIVLFAAALALWSLVAGPLGLLLGFIAIRGLGQGSLSLVNSTAIAQWFRRRRGRMMSLSIVAFGLFQSVYVPWLQSLLEIHNWRHVWLILAACVVGITLPLSWLLLRDRPEDFGLLPDGDSQSLNHETAGTPADLEDNWTLREALHTGIFWVFVMGRILSPAWGTGLIFHQISVFQSLGYDATTATQVYSLFTIISAGVSLIAGYLIDRFRPGHIMIAQISTMMAALAMAAVMTEAWMLVVYALAFGFTMGNGGVFDGSVWTNLFGRLHQGAIRGFVSTAMVMGTALGPVMFGISYDLSGSYTPVLLLGIGLAIIPLILSFFVKLPHHSPEITVSAAIGD